MKKGIMELLKMKLMMELVMELTLIYIAFIAKTINLHLALIQMDVGKHKKVISICQAKLTAYLK